MIHRQYEDYGMSTEREFLAGLQSHGLEESCTSSGIPLCYKDNTIYTDDSDSHTLIFGNTGTKKTRNFCIPGVYAIGMAGESMVISDPKGEIYRNTSGFMAHQGYDIRVMNLREPERGAKWNPLTLPYRYYWAGDTDRAVEMITDFAMQLKVQVHTEKDLYWENQAMELLIGIILILFESESDEKNVHMESVQRIRMYIKAENKEEEGNIFWKWIESFPEKSLIRYKLASVYALRNTEKTLSCVVSTFDSMVHVFLFNRKIMKMLSASQISFDTLGEKKTVLYLITPDEKTTFHFLVSVFIKQCYECLIAYAQGKEEGILPLRVNFILDEFSNFPKIADMPAMISAARSRNIRFTLVVQSKQQLLSMYGDDAETIKSNCKNWIYLSCRELGLLREIEELCGKVYVGGRGEVPLLDISQLQRLKIGWEDSQALILRAAQRPYISWVKDFTSYPQSKYEMLPLYTERELCLEMDSFFDKIREELLDEAETDETSLDNEE